MFPSLQVRFLLSLTRFLRSYLGFIGAFYKENCPNNIVYSGFCFFLSFKTLKLTKSHKTSTIQYWSPGLGPEAGTRFTIRKRIQRSQNPMRWKANHQKSQYMFSGTKYQIFMIPLSKCLSLRAVPTWAVQGSYFFVRQQNYFEWTHLLQSRIIDFSVPHS